MLLIIQGSCTDDQAGRGGTVVVVGRLVMSLAEHPALITLTQHDKWMSSVPAVKSVIG